MRRVIALVLVLALLATLAGACAKPTPTIAPKTLKIGSIGPYSGGSAPWGLNMLHNFELLVEEVNNAGGLVVAGQPYKIELISYDHKGRADEATTVAKKLVFDDKVKYIIGNAVGATTDAAQLVTEENKVLFTFGSWGIKNLGTDKPYSFRSWPGALEVGPPFYGWLAKKYPNVKTVAIINPNDTSGWDCAKGGKLGAEQTGIKVVADIYYERGTKEFGPFVTKLLAANPDMIDFSGTQPGDAGLMAKGLLERGYKGLKVYTAGLDTFTYMGVGGEAAEGTLTPVGWDFYGGKSVPAAASELAKKYQDRFKEPASMQGISNYIAGQVIFEAMKRAGSTDVDKVLEVMTTQKFDTVMGPLVIIGKDTYGINRQFMFALVAAEMKGGKMNEIEAIK